MSPRVVFVREAAVADSLRALPYENLRASHKHLAENKRCGARLPPLPNFSLTHLPSRYARVTIAAIHGRLAAEHRPQARRRRCRRVAKSITRDVASSRIDTTKSSKAGSPIPSLHLNVITLSSAVTAIPALPIQAFWIPTLSRHSFHTLMLAPLVAGCAITSNSRGAVSVQKIASFTRESRTSSITFSARIRRACGRVVVA